MIAKIIGFLIPASLLVSIIYSVVTHSLWENLVIIASIFVLILVIEFVVARIFKTSKLVAELKAGMMKFGKGLNLAIVSFALIFVYIVGVGVVWLLSRIVRKKFMKISPPRDTAWETKDKEIDYTEMF